MAVQHRSTVFKTCATPLRIAPLRREAIENQIEALISLLDRMDGDIDLEDGDEDRCAAYDDEPRQAYFMFGPGDGYPGDPDDAEEEDDMCLAGDDGCGAVYRNGNLYWGSDHEDDGVLTPRYGVDQTAGPLPEPQFGTAVH